MVIFHFNSEDFFDYINKQGCKEYSNDDFYLDNSVVIYLSKKTRSSVPIQIRSTYYPIYISKICDALEISIPKECKKYHDQLSTLRKMQKKRDKK